MGNLKKLLIYYQKKYKKISPLKLQIKSPKETGKSFKSNARLKVKFFPSLLIMVSSQMIQDFA